MDKEESKSKRLHQDWWAQCRTCKFWSSTDPERGVANPGMCDNLVSVNYKQETWSSGYCPQWDTFDIETALEILQEDEKFLADGAANYEKRLK